MADRDLTKAERLWLRRLQRALDDQPRSLTIYWHGGNATTLDTDTYEQCDDSNLTDAILECADVIRAPNTIAGDF